MKPGHVLDPATGLPKVVPVRTTDGQLVFAYETRRSGGMSVLVDVPDEALSGRRAGEVSDAADQNALLAEAARGVAEQLIADGDGSDVAPDPGRHAVRVEDRTTDEMAKRLADAEAKEKEAREIEAAAVARVEEAENEASEREVEMEELRRQLAEAQEKAKKPPARPRSGAKSGTKTKAAA